MVAAEKLLFNSEVSDLGADDLSDSPKKSENRIPASHSTTTRTPYTSVHPIRPLPELYPVMWNHSGSSVLPMAVEVSELVGREVQRYIDSDTEKMALNGLQQNRYTLEKLASELEQRIKLTGEAQVKQIVQSMDPVMLPDVAGPLLPAKLDTEDLTPWEIRCKIYNQDDVAVYAPPFHRG